MARVLALVSASALFGLLAAPSAFGADIGVSTRVTGYGGLAGKVQERINRTPTRGAVAARTE